MYGILKAGLMFREMEAFMYDREVLCKVILLCTPFVQIPIYDDGAPIKKLFLGIIPGL